MKLFGDKSAYIISSITGKKDRFWDKIRERQALRLLHKAAEEVPAYKDFLKRRKINHYRVKTFWDFKRVPQTSKKEYLRRYPLKDLVSTGTLKRPLSFSATSGSTGEPFYFSRSSGLEWESSIVHEFFLRNSSYGSNLPTLVLVCFGMGVWIGGLITHRAFQLAGERGLPVSVLAPGINKIEIFNALKKLAPNFAQVILAGYPPFIKDIIDEAPEYGVNLGKLNIRLLFAAEAFSEKFRDYVTKKAKVKNIYLDTMNIYGTADIGTMAFETPTSILLRRLALRNKKLFAEIFGDIKKTPTLAQYNPLFITFEEAGGEILLTGNNAVPLIRYNIGDHGGVYSFGEIAYIFKKYGVDIKKEVKSAGIDKLSLLPFVYVYERTDLATTLYGLQIYPEMIREALLEKSIAHALTGKFALATKFSSKQNQYLEINLELKKGARATQALKKLALKKIIAALLVKSSEFRELYRQLKDRAVPKLMFWPAEHPLYFKPGTKQKWVLK